MAKNTTFSTPDYMSPVCRIIEVKAQSVLCGSGSVNGIPSFENDDIQDYSDAWK